MDEVGGVMLNSEKRLPLEADTHRPNLDQVPWRKTIRRSSGLVEHVCQHGVGHPAYASVDYLSLTGGSGNARSWGVHGCDGCCSSEAWILGDLFEGIHRANELIIEEKNQFHIYKEEHK